MFWKLLSCRVRTCFSKEIMRQDYGESETDFLFVCFSIWLLPNFTLYSQMFYYCRNCRGTAAVKLTLESFRISGAGPVLYDSISTVGTMCRAGQHWCWTRWVSSWPATRTSCWWWLTISCKTYLLFRWWLLESPRDIKNGTSLLVLPSMVQSIRRAKRYYCFEKWGALT